MNFLTLNPKATILGLAIGILMIILGRAFGLFFFILMFWFLIISAIVSFIGKKYKIEKRLFEDSRGVKNVIANGLWPLIIVILYYFLYLNYPITLIFAFVGGVAAVAADKFSSEIGVLDGEPIMLFTLKRVKKGTSGGITPLGTFAGLVGAILIGLIILFAYSFLYIHGVNPSVLFAAAVISGLAGTLFDSLLGYFEEKHIGTKYSTNFFASMFGSLIAIIILLLI